MKHLYLLLLIPLFFSCTTIAFRVLPSYQLVSDQESPAEINTYRDSLIEISFTPTAELYGFTLVNKTDEPMYINWEETSFIKGDVAGPVINKDVDYYDKSLPMKPTLIPPKMRRVDNIIPVEHVVINDFGARLQSTEEAPSFKDHEQIKRYLESAATQGVYLTLNTSTGPIAYQFTFDNKGKIVSYDAPIGDADNVSATRTAVVIFIIFGLAQAVIW